MRDSDALLRFVFTAADRAGVNQEALCNALGCTPALLSAPCGRYPHELQPYFWAAVEQITGNDEIGLALCADLPGFDGHSLEYALLSSATLREGIDFFIKYRRLLSDAMQAMLIDDDRGTRLSFRASAYPEPQYRHTEIVTTYAILRALRAVSFSVPLVLRAELAVVPRRHRTIYEAVFGCPVSFDSHRNAIWLRADALDCSSPLANPEIARLHRQFVGSRSRGIARQDLLDRVHVELYKHCRAGYGANPRLGEIACRIGVSERQLRDTLSELGTSFRQTCSQTRIRVAERLLVETEAPLDYIAQVAGFADLTALSRAFAQMRGVPPLRFRRHAGANRQNLAKPPEAVLQALLHKALKRVVVSQSDDRTRVQGSH